MVRRKRPRATAKNTAPMPSRARNCGHTTSMPAPRYKMAWPSSTKWVVGAASIRSCTSAGMLSRGVVPPESSCSGISVSTSSRPNCGMLRASVVMKIPMDVVANRCSEAPARNSAIEPPMGTRSSPCTTSSSETLAASSTTSAIDHTLASMISVGGDGHDQQVLDGAVLTLADQGGPGEDDGEHGDVVDHCHEAAKPGFFLRRVKAHTQRQLHRQGPGCHGSAG